MISRKCFDCKTDKDLNDFNKWSYDKIYNKKYVCRECESKREKLYRQKNLDKLKVSRRKRYLKNKEKVLIQTNNYKKNKKLNEPEFKIICNLRDRHSKAVKNAGNNKNFKTTNLLGCSANELKLYFESMFNPDMNWSNYGKVWNIDHIYPLSRVNWENLDEVKVACHYTNLQPLYCYDNILKGNKVFKSK